MARTSLPEPCTASKWIDDWVSKWNDVLRDVETASHTHAVYMRQCEIAMRIRSHLNPLTAPKIRHGQMVKVEKIIEEAARATLESEKVPAATFLTIELSISNRILLIEMETRQENELERLRRLVMKAA